MFEDTHRWGSLEIDAQMLLEDLYSGERGEITDTERTVLELLEESGVPVQFVRNHTLPQQIPLVYLDHFGGYPGDSIDEANKDAAKDYARDYNCIVLESNWFGGCESVAWYIDVAEATVSEVEEILGIIEDYRNYPVLSEELWSEYSHNAWVELIDTMIGYIEMDFDFVPTDAQIEVLREEAMEYAGHWEEGYFPDELWTEMVTNVKDLDDENLHHAVQLHQETALW